LTRGVACRVPADGEARTLRCRERPGGHSKRAAGSDLDLTDPARERGGIRHRRRLHEGEPIGSGSRCRAGKPELPVGAADRAKSAPEGDPYCWPRWVAQAAAVERRVSKTRADAKRVLLPAVGSVRLARDRVMYVAGRWLGCVSPSVRRRTRASLNCDRWVAIGAFRTTSQPPTVRPDVDCPQLVTSTDKTPLADDD
jgi:hypothetical protein